MDQDKSPGRMIAIGDIHGCHDALRAILDAIRPQPEDTIVTLGDYIDRGPNSRDVVEQLMELSNTCELVTLMGNHEVMLLMALNGPAERNLWLSVGGQETLESYRTHAELANVSTESAVDATDPADWADVIPSRHLEFFEACALAYETETHIFVHANYLADQPIAEQNEEVLLWHHLIPKQIPGPHISGKTVIVGHTPQHDGEVLNLRHLVCIDTYCFGDGWLTALEVNSGEIWQADQFGNLRGSRD